MDWEKLQNKIKLKSRKYWNRFRYWFTSKDHPRSKLNTKVFFYDSLWFVGLLLCFLIVYSNVESFNQINLWFLQLGSIVLLGLLFLLLRKIYQLGLNARYGLRGLNNGLKVILAIGLVLLIFWGFTNQDTVVSATVESYEDIEFRSFIPVTADINKSKFNFSSFKLPDLVSELSSCPQIDVPMIDRGKYFSPTISGQTYDGWTIKGQATCRKGTKEGENLNKYYCGGFTSTFIGSQVNAYVEKTTISEDGNIGKTHKHVIWNIYEENKKFVETRCLGDPDEFEEKQAKAFERELRSWV